MHRNQLKFFLFHLSAHLGLSLSIHKESPTCLSYLLFFYLFSLTYSTSTLTCDRLAFHPLSPILCFACWLYLFTSQYTSNLLPIPHILTPHSHSTLYSKPISSHRIFSPSSDGLLSWSIMRWHLGHFGALLKMDQ